MSASANTATLVQSYFNPDVRRKINFVLFALAVFVFGTHIPSPGIDRALVDDFFQRTGAGGLFGFMDLFSGGALKKLSIFALGIMPYINASIMMQLAVAVFPELKQRQQEGEEGRKWISKITRYLAVGLAFLQGVGLLISIYSGAGHSFLSFNGIAALFSIVGGTCFLMWLGDEISTKGIGNGTSMIIMIGIVARVPASIWQELQASRYDQTRIIALVLILLLTVFVVAAVVFIQLSARKIPVQYARRQIGKRVYGGQSTYLPIKVTHAGVIPIIFAISVLMIPQTLASFMQGNWPSFNRLWAQFSSGPLYPLVEFTLVVVFTFVYTAVTFQTKDIADNMKKNSGFIPGIRPGRPTEVFLDKVLNRVTLLGGLFLGLVAIMPVLVSFMVEFFTKVRIDSIYIGGTSLLIVVGVALDTVQQMQAHMIMRHYSGFNK